VALLREVVLTAAGKEPRIYLAEFPSPLFLHAPDSSSFKAFLASVQQCYVRTDETDARGREVYALTSRRQ
jgi:hypothetical protein